MQHRVAPTLENEAVLWCGASAQGRLEQSFGFSLCISTSTPFKGSHNYTYAAWQFCDDIFILLVKQQKIPVFLWATVSCCLRNLYLPSPLSFKQRVIGSGCKSLEVKLNHSQQPDIVFPPHPDLWGQLFPSFHNSRNLDSLFIIPIYPWHRLQNSGFRILAHIFKLKTVNLQAAAESNNFRQLLDGDKVCTDVHPHPLLIRISQMSCCLDDW